jgi:hypothetical protein
MFIAQAGSTVETTQQLGSEVAWLNGPPIDDYIAAGTTVEVETQNYQAPGTAEWDAVLSYPLEAVDTNYVRAARDGLTAACAN